MRPSLPCPGITCLQTISCFLWFTVFSPNTNTYALGSLLTKRNFLHSKKVGKNDFHGSLGQALPLPSRAPCEKTLKRVLKFSYWGVVLDGEPFLHGKITSSMLAARSVGGLDFCLVNDHASRWKPLNRYTRHFGSRYLTVNGLPFWNSSEPRTTKGLCIKCVLLLHMHKPNFLTLDE